MSFVTFPIDSTIQVLIDKTAPGLQVYDMLSASNTVIGLDYLLASIGHLSMEERAELARLMMDVTIARKVMRDLIGELARKVTLPLAAAHGELLNEALVKATSTVSFASPKVARALHGAYYVALKRMGLVPDLDITTMLLVPRRTLLPSLERMEVDMIKYTLRKSVEIPDLTVSKVEVGHVLVQRLSNFLTHFALQITYAGRLVHEFRIVLGSIYDHVTRTNVSAYRESKAPFPFLRQVLNLVDLALTIDPVYRIHLPATENHEWSVAIENVYAYLGSAESDLGLISADTYASFFSVQRLRREEEFRYCYIHVSRALDDNPKLSAIGVHKVDVGATNGDTKLLIRNELVTARIKEWQAIATPLLQMQKWRELAATVVGRGDMPHDTFIMTCTPMEYKYLALLNTNGMRVSALPDGRADVTYQFVLDSERIHRKHIDLPGRAVIGNLVDSEVLDDVFTAGQLIRPLSSSHYPTGPQVPDKWMSSALVHMSGLRFWDLAKSEIRRFRSYASGTPATVEAELSPERLFDIHHFARAVSILENPVTVGTFATSIVTAIGISGAIWSQSFARRQYGKAVAMQFQDILTGPEVIRGAYLLLYRAKISLRTASDYDAARTWGHAAVAAALAMIRTMGQLPDYLLWDLRDATDFIEHIDDVLITKTVLGTV